MILNGCPQADNSDTPQPTDLYGITTTSTPKVTTTPTVTPPPVNYQLYFSTEGSGVIEISATITIGGDLYNVSLFQANVPPTIFYFNETYTNTGYSWKTFFGEPNEFMNATMTPIVCE